MFQGLKRRIGDMAVIRQLCLEAEAYARKDGLREPGAEHFLLAALDLPDGTARRAFERVGGNHESLEATIAAQHHSALDAFGLTPNIDLEPSTPGPADGLYHAAPSGQQVMQELAAHRPAGSRGLVGADVVAVVAGFRRGVAARTLGAMGIQRDALRQAALQESGAAP